MVLNSDQQFYSSLMSYSVRFVFVYLPGRIRTHVQYLFPLTVFIYKSSRTHYGTEFTFRGVPSSDSSMFSGPDTSSESIPELADSDCSSRSSFSGSTTQLVCSSYALKYYVQDLILYYLLGLYSSSESSLSNTRIRLLFCGILVSS